MKNEERYKEYQKKYRQQNRKRLCEYGRKYYQKNKEKLKKYLKKYRKTNMGHLSHLVDAVNQRCTNSNYKQYKYYGGRGIQCLFTTKELHDWIIAKNVNFHGLQIHRIDNDGDYTLDNIVFVTDSEHKQLHKKK